MTSRKWGILVISMRVSPWCVWGGWWGGVGRAAGAALGWKRGCCSLRRPRLTILPLHTHTHTPSPSLSLSPPTLTFSKHFMQTDGIASGASSGASTTTTSGSPVTTGAARGASREAGGADMGTSVVWSAAQAAREERSLNNGRRFCVFKTFFCHPLFLPSLKSSCSCCVSRRMFAF